MPFTNYLDLKLLDYLLQGVSYTPPAPLYVGLSSTQPTQIAGSTAPYWNTTELSGNGYAADTVTSNTSDWIPLTTPLVNGYGLQNGIVIAFPTSTAAWNAGQPIGYF